MRRWLIFSLLCALLLAAVPVQAAPAAPISVQFSRQGGSIVMSWQQRSDSSDWRVVRQIIGQGYWRTMAEGVDGSTNASHTITLPAEVSLGDHLYIGESGIFYGPFIVPNLPLTSRIKPRTPARPGIPTPHRSPTS
jgi:hypothetical protein